MFIFIQDNTNRDDGDSDLDDPMKSDDIEDNKQPNLQISNDNKEQSKKKM